MEESPQPKLSPREELFVREYLRCLNASEACRRSGYSTGNRTRLMTNPLVKSAIAEALSAGLTETSMEAAELIREMARIVRADPNEIIEYRRVNCRHCWGEDHRYQYTTQNKLDEATRAFDKTPDGLVGSLSHGGVGFDASREPNEDCPECNGEGHGDVFVKDTRLLSPAARSLYAGVKISKDGVEIKMHSKDKQMEMLARVLGILNDKLELGVAEDLVSRLMEGRKRAGGA